MGGPTLNGDLLWGPSQGTGAILAPSEVHLLVEAKAPAFPFTGPLKTTSTSALMTGAGPGRMALTVLGESHGF